MRRAASNGMGAHGAPVKYGPMIETKLTTAIAKTVHITGANQG
jgi:hypothetical protein